jgi:hypothetical protein
MYRFASLADELRTNFREVLAQLEDLRLYFHLIFKNNFALFQTGDSGPYLATLAATLADELRTNFSEVLAQLEDLRLAEWADQAPPPPSHPRHHQQQQQQQQQHQLHNYANYPSRVRRYLFLKHWCRAMLVRLRLRK